MYKLIKNNLTGQINTVNKIEEDKILSIPFDPANMDFVEYQKWLSEGNVPIPADKPSA